MKIIKVGLLGNPNCGKSTLFNALTGARQQVGNWPGVTVERKSGYFKQDDWQVEIIDLPGVYSLMLSSENHSIDERIACETILSGELDLVVNILDATNLERNLYLTTQILDMQVPVIVAVNMMDIAIKQQISIDLPTLSATLKCPVIGISSTKKTGLNVLRETILKCAAEPLAPTHIINYPEPIASAITQVASAVIEKHPEKTSSAYCLALHILKGSQLAEQYLPENYLSEVVKFRKIIEKKLEEEADILIADSRYSLVHEICKKVVKKASVRRQNITQAIDRIVLHRLLGIPIFLFIMYLLFFFSINIGGAFQPFFDISSEALFVKGMGQGLTALGLPDWITAIVAAGVGKGINTTITFVPVIGSLFLFLAFLEGSGYMARAAFVMDRFMRAIGLPGKSFVPMIVGFGCNVPAIMAARTLESKRDRILTILMSPFMSCGARLAIYAVFTAAFFPKGGQNVIFALYFIGVIMAILTGMILRRTVLKGDPSPLIMELPPYHLPTLRAIFMQAWQRLKSFVFRAGKLIVPICVLIGALNSVTIEGKLVTPENNQNSVLSAIGRTVTPIFSPLGIKQDNWPATVGLVSGVLAKEVVVGTLNTLYTQMGHLTIVEDKQFNLKSEFKDAFSQVGEGLKGLKNSFSNPILASAPDHDINQGVFGIMYKHFDGQLGAFAYLLFILLYFPCVSATAAMMRELNRNWTIFSIIWATGMAYAVAVIFYQSATFIHHPMSSCAWIVGLLIVLTGVLWGMRYYANSDKFTKANKRTAIYKPG